mmetsp:Transcript_55295/g.161361  ORF Transcript_55295/g.161361 Transcript_55295/m.161361 type:complete len:111 (-) Transcript_55295:67-399(-)
MPRCSTGSPPRLRLSAAPVIHAFLAVAAAAQRQTGATKAVAMTCSPQSRRTILYTTGQVLDLRRLPGFRAVHGLPWALAAETPGLQDLAFGRACWLASSRMSPLPKLLAI